MRQKKIKIPPNYIRKYSKNIPSLKKALKRYGQVYPILVDKEGYLLDGKRRLEALKDKRKKVKVLNVPLEKRLEFSLMLNLSRETLNPIDLAKALQSYQNQQGISQREIAKRLPISKSRVQDHLKLLSLPKDVQRLIAKGRIKMYQIEKLGKQKKKISSIEKFKDISGDRQFLSVTNRISSIKTMIGETTMAKEQLFRVKEKVCGLMEIVDKKLVENENGTSNTKRKENK